MKILKTSHKGYIQFVILNKQNKIKFSFRKDLDIMERVRHITENRFMSSNSKYKLYKMNRVCTYMNLYQGILNKIKGILWKS